MPVGIVLVDSIAVFMTFVENGSRRTTDSSLEKDGAVDDANAVGKKTSKEKALLAQMSRMEKISTTHFPMEMLTKKIQRELGAM
jgi:hypothetical protein